MAQCEICGTNLEKDLFAACTREPVCCVCKVKFIGGLPTTPERIAAARVAIGLADREYLQQDNGAEAARILGRGGR